MACNNYVPRFQDQINPNDSMGGLSCTCYSAAMAGDNDTCGAKVPTGKRVRQLTGDTVGGTTLAQVDYALNKGWGINLDTRVGSNKLTWAQFEAKLAAGRGAIVQGSYSVFHNTKWAASRTFVGNHAIYVPHTWKAMDPLADGRYSGCYKYHGEVYPKDLIKKFAGLLMLDAKKRKTVGIGYVWCSLTRDVTATYKATIKPKTGETTRMFYQYHVTDGIITSREARYTTGFTHTVTAPKLFIADSGEPYKSKSLVKILTGTTRKGWYINAGWSYEA